MNVQNVNSVQAYNFLISEHNSILIDVRTSQEWSKVGVPYLDNNKSIVFLSWQLLPFMALNKDFAINLTSIITDKKTHLFFLCRSGHRSLAAGAFAANLGYKNCYNIIDGFEGDNQNPGWKYNNLPWHFSE